MENRKDVQIDSLKQRIKALEDHLENAKETVQGWIEANAELSRSAAEARAKNQGAATGVMASLLGSKYRGAMRRSASASNASIARDVAKKRAQIAENKQAAQKHVRDLKSKITDMKNELKVRIANKKSIAQRQERSRKQKAGSIDLLYKLKEAHELGLLTDEEYEVKRKALVSKI